MRTFHTAFHSHYHKQEKIVGYRSDIGLTLTQSAVQTLLQQLNVLDKKSEAFYIITNLFT